MLGDYVDIGGVEFEEPIVGVIREILQDGNMFGILADRYPYIFHAKEVFPIKLTKDFFLKKRIRTHEGVS